MSEPVLIIMAAGMGSRYGGLKQIDPIGMHGELIIDFSIYDAIQAGFKKVVFIIKEEDEQHFKEAIGNRIQNAIEVVYVYQDRHALPEGFSCPEGRTKPWGTGHALLCCKAIVTEPCAVINADDYYGPFAFKAIYDYLKNTQDTDTYSYGMVGYTLSNTLTTHGHVARGVCSTNGNLLSGICERTHIAYHDNSVQYLEGDTWTPLTSDTLVSMNLWGFTPSIFHELEKAFPSFLEDALHTNPLKAEFFLPFVVDTLLKQDKAKVHVLHSTDRWHGVTYKEDKPMVIAAIQALQADGIYPHQLWEESYDTHISS